MESLPTAAPVLTCFRLVVDVVVVLQSHTHVVGIQHSDLGGKTIQHNTGDVAIRTHEIQHKKNHDWQGKPMR